MNVRTRLARASLLVAVVASVLALAGCGSEIQGQAVAKSGTVPATGGIPTSKTPAPTRTAPPSQNGGDEGGDVDIDVEIGDCVQLGGTVDDATIDNAVCGSPDSNYKVVAKVPTSDLCATDVDQYYYESFAGVEQGALCLDIDWVIGGCIDLGDGSDNDDPVRIQCGDPADDAVQVNAILTGTSDVDDCSPPSGIVYDERNFVVCLEEL